MFLNRAQKLRRHVPESAIIAMLHYAMPFVQCKNGLSGEASNLELVERVMNESGKEKAITIANDTIYGLYHLRAGTVGHNGFKNDFGIAFGGFKQSGLGREGGVEGLRAYLEARTMVFETAPKAAQ